MTYDTLRSIIIDQAAVAGYGSYSGIGGNLLALPHPGEGGDQILIHDLELVEPLAGALPPDWAPVSLRLENVDGLQREEITLTFSAQPADTNTLAYDDPFNGVITLEYDSTGAFTIGRRPVVIGPTYWHTAFNTYLEILKMGFEGVCPAEVRFVNPSIQLGAGSADTDTIIITTASATKTFELDNNGAWTAGNHQIEIGASFAETMANLKTALDSAFPDDADFAASIDPANTDTIFIEGATFTTVGAGWTATNPIIYFNTRIPGTAGELTPTNANVWVASAAQPVVAIPAAGVSVAGGTLIDEFTLLEPGHNLEVNERYTGGIYAEITGANARVKIRYRYAGLGRLKGLTSHKSTAQY